MKTSYRSLCCFTLIALCSIGAVPALKGKHAPHPKETMPTSVAGLRYELIPIPFSAVHHHQAAAPHIRIAESTSANWSGYAAQASSGSGVVGSVTDVQGSWVVPTVTGSRRHTSYSSSWVGIDGYSDGTVEQLGTESDWASNGQRNYAWFEMYPAGGYMISGFPVFRGDTISAEVSYLGNNVYQLSIVNHTHPASFTVPYSYTTTSAGLRTSAEWIVEAPSSGGVLPLANFGTEPFANCQATINGVAGPIDASGFVDPLTMIDPRGGTATPSSLTDNSGESSFTVTY
jgi:hypothetical protein